jgi:hypothetical protein
LLAFVVHWLMPLRSLRNHLELWQPLKRQTQIGAEPPATPSGWRESRDIVAALGMVG